MVAPYPSYGCGVGGWRDSLTVASNLRVRSGHVGFWGWLLAQAREVPKEHLLCDLPEV